MRRWYDPDPMLTGRTPLGTPPENATTNRQNTTTPTTTRTPRDNRPTRQRHNQPRTTGTPPNVPRDYPKPGTPFTSTRRRRRSNTEAKSSRFFIFFSKFLLLFFFFFFFFFFFVCFCFDLFSLFFFFFFFFFLFANPPSSPHPQLVDPPNLGPHPAASRETSQEPRHQPPTARETRNGGTGAAGRPTTAWPALGVREKESKNPKLAHRGRPP